MTSTEHELERRMIHAAHQRAEVTYQDRHDVTRTGTLPYWPSSTRPRRSGARAKIRTAGGHHLAVAVDRVTPPAPGALLNPQPSTSTTAGQAQPSTLDPDSRVSVHDFGRPGSVLARDVRGRPEGRPSPRQGPDTR
jgi:hypothetical protein